MQATRNARRRSASSNAATVLQEAAKRNGVPLWALVGVKLSEDGTSTSAQGGFGIEPATQKSLGIKSLSNFAEVADGAARLLASYHKQFGSWSRAFEAYNGGPGAVGQGYAYNEAHVLAKLAEFGTSKAALTRAEKVPAGTKVNASFLGPLGEGFSWLQEHFGGLPAEPLRGAEGKPPGALEEAGGAAKSGIGGIGSGLEAIGSFFELLLKGETWLRIGEVLAGAILIFLALKGLTGVELPTPGVKLGA
jgi:hypothetical protein